ncbi:MAG: ribonuclease HII, partial [Rhodobacteraceae bacterium]|nr:ribonuclease HII [Paracoccaceae bacterium]
MLLPSFSLENKLINAGLNFIAGTDEVGRGAWAGPVTAAAVILNPKKIPNGINDSKKLTKNKRNRLSDEIIATSISYSVIHISVFEIDKINILEASMLAMRNAALSLD